MARRLSIVVILALLGALLPAQEQKPKEPQKKQEEKKPEVEPPEEDVAAVQTPKEYSFNPIQSKKEVDIGNYYFKKGAYNSAKGRFDEATKWDPGNSEAWLRLGDAYERLKDEKAARGAFNKYLELAPDGKSAALVRKKLLAGRK